MSSELEARLQAVKRASFQMARLKEEEKNLILEDFATELEGNQKVLFSANQKDLKAHTGQITESLYQRLKLDQAKLVDLTSGLRDLKRLKDPTGITLWRRELDEDLILEKRSVPLGVFAVIFESRPDVFPQVASLALKSGNALILKGGKEAHHTNHAMFEVILRVSERHPKLPKDWIMLIDSREEIRKILSFPQYIDLVIPRGSNELVQSVQKESLIPVLGHADGVCHIYLHRAANVKKAWDLILDAKTQYPSACNSVETLLVDRSWGESFLQELQTRCKERGIRILGCPWVQQVLIHAGDVPSWHTEYGDLTLAVKGVLDLAEATDHINEFGSHHTDMIISEDAKAMEEFFERVDSASVFANASTRFADGYRFGMGAEIGISTSKTHARGPVGLEGLVSYKYLLRGRGQVVASYVGPGSRKFTHKGFFINLVILIASLWSCRAFAIGYPYSLSPHNYLKQRFGFELFVESVNFEINKTGVTTPASQAALGARAGISAAMGITAWIGLFMSADYFIGSGDGATSSLFRFEQLAIGKLARRGFFAFGAGLQAYLLKTSPTEYGYNGLLGPMIYFAFEPRYFLLYVKGGPVSNSSSQISSNLAYNAGLQIGVWNFGFGPLKLNAEIGRIDFFATIPEEQSVLSTVSVGLSQTF